VEDCGAGGADIIFLSHSGQSRAIGAAERQP